MTTDVDPDYRVQPNLIEYGTVEVDDPAPRQIRMWRQALAHLAITNIRSNNEAFSARQVASPPGTDDLLIEATFSGRTLSKSGPVSGTFSIKTTSPGNPITEVLLHAQYISPFEVEPPSISIGAGVTGSVEREIRIEAVRPIRLLAVRSSDPAVKPTLVGSDTGRNISIKAVASDEKVRRSINGVISVDLALNPGAVACETRTVSIPFYRLALE